MKEIYKSEVSKEIRSIKKKLKLVESELPKYNIGFVIYKMNGYYSAQDYVCNREYLNKTIAFILLKNKHLSSNYYVNKCGIEATISYKNCYFSSIVNSRLSCIVNLLICFIKKIFNKFDLNFELEPISDIYGKNGTVRIFIKNK